MNKNNNLVTDHFLDITSEICPMTFVKTKLLIEEMAVNDVAEVRLQGREPLANIPQSIKDFGHQIISLHPENCKEDKYGIHRLRIKKVI